MIKNKKVIVDIDNTFWHFCDILYERLREINPHRDTGGAICFEGCYVLIAMKTSYPRVS